MQINSFSSFFEIFAGLNLAYATSNWFRSAIDNKIQTLNLTIEPLNTRISELKDKAFLLSESTNYDYYRNEIEKITIEFNRTKIDIENGEKLFDRLTILYRPIFLMTSFYCFYIILLGGFEQFFAKSFTITNLAVGQNLITNTHLICIHFVLVFNLVVFARSFSKSDFLSVKLRVPVFLIILLFFLATIIANIYPFFLPELGKQVNGKVVTIFPWGLSGGKTNVLIAIFISISPYLLHLIRIYTHEIQYYRKLIILKSETADRINQFNAIFNSPFKEIKRKQSSLEKFTDAISTWFEEVRIWRLAARRDYQTLFNNPPTSRELFDVEKTLYDIHHKLDTIGNQIHLIKMNLSESESTSNE